MKRQYIAALGIGGIVLMTVLIGLGVFLYFGSQAGVYVIGIGAPLVVVIATGLYVQQVLNRGSTSQSDFVQQAARSAGKAFRDELTVFNRLESTYSRWEPDTVQTQAQQLAADFGDAGVDVDLDAATFTIQSPDRVQEFDRLEEEVDAFAASRDEEFLSFAGSEINRARDGAATVTDSAGINDLNENASLEAAERMLSDARETAAMAYREAAERIESALEEYDGDRARVESHLTNAHELIESHDWEGALNALRQAHQTTESEVYEAFSADYETVEQLLSTVESVDVEPYADERDIETFVEARARLNDIDTVLAGDELDALETEVRAAAGRVIATLEDELQRHISVIRDADVPKEFYTVPSAAATDYGERLAETDHLAAFREGWLSVTGELLEAIEKAERKASVADSYAIVEERIIDELRSTGQVTGTDLPVREPEQFMSLYADTHPEVEYDSVTPELLAPDSGESYELTVNARLASANDEEHELVTALSGKGVERQKTTSTDVGTETTFKDVSYGEYTVAARTPSEAFTDQEQTVNLANDESLDLVLSKVSLRDRVCDGDEDEVRNQLSTVSDRLTEEFEREEYLTPESSIRIADEYIPCLLVLWAEETGHEARMDDGQLLVYDDEQFRSRLETITTHNLTDGDTMTYNAMRRKFLSVPASDELIAGTLRELNTGVSIGETGVNA